MKSISVSLYNFLDHKKNGKVTFVELVERIYPHLIKTDLNTIVEWSQEYSQNFNLYSKIKANKKLSENKKKSLPKSCIPRLNQFFKLFDHDNKGYVVF